MHPLDVGLIAVGTGLTVGVLILWRLYLRKRGFAVDRNSDGVWLGGYSPVLSWLKTAWQKRLWRIWLNPPASDAERFLPSAATDKPAAGTESIAPWPSRLWLLSLALGLAALGQGILLYEPPEKQGAGLACYLAGMAVFVWLGRRLERPEAVPQYRAAPFEQRGPTFALWLVSLALCFWTMQNVTADASLTLGHALAATWVLSIAVFSWSVLRVEGWQWPKPQALRAWWRAHWIEVAALTVLVAAALVIRLYKLELEPYAVANDEGEHGRGALEILRGQLANMFDSTYGSQAGWALVPRAIAIGIFGNTVFGLRIVSALEGTLSLVFLYLLGREIFNRQLAGLACLFLVALPWHIQFSRVGVTSSALLVYSTALVWLTYRALRQGRVTDYLWVGIVTGLTFYTYVGARVIGALVVGTLGFVAIRQRDYLRAHLRHLLVLAVSIAIVIAPQLVWYRAHSDIFAAQTNGHAILSNGWLQTEAQQRPGGVLAVLAQQFEATTLVYILTPAGGGFFFSPAPYLVPVAAVLFMLGLGYSLAKLKDPRYVTLVAWLGGTVVAGALTDLPPANERLILSAPAVALFVALGLQQTASLAKALKLLPAKLASVGCVALVVLVGAQNLYFYVDTYIGQHCYTDLGQEVTYEAGNFAASLGPAYRMYVIGDGAPQVFANFGNFRYLAADEDPVNFNTVNADTLGKLPREGGAFFLAVPTRRPDLELVARLVPGGRWIEVDRRYQVGELLYLGYILAPQQFSQR